MKKILVLFFLLFTCCIFPQDYKFAWLTDVHIGGSPTAEADLTAAVEDINNEKDIKFVVVSGDIAEKGRTDELEKAKSILDKLNIKYYIIPGNHDTKWSETAGAKFSELWGDDKFAFEHNKTKIIGINSGITWRGGGGHLALNDLNWLKETLEQTGKEEEVILFVHHPLEADVDNWFMLTNILRDYNIKAVLVGHGHTNTLKNFNGIPGAMSRSNLSKGAAWGYTIAENKKDSLIFYEAGPDSISKVWGAINKSLEKNVPLIDSLQFINYDADVLWQTDLQTTLIAPLLYADGKFFASSKSGIVSCYDITGKLLWDYDAYGTLVSRPVYFNGALAVGTIEGDLAVLNAETGEAGQVLSVGEAITSQLIMIEYTGTKRLMQSTGAPMPAVVLGTASGKLMCFDINYLQPIWSNADAKGMIESQPVYTENKIIYGAWDGHLYCIDARTGLQIWKWTENNNFYFSPAACSPVDDGKSVYVSTPDKFVSRIDILLGKTQWRKNDFTSWESIGLSSDSLKLYVKGYMDNFSIVNAADGKLIKEISMHSGLDTAPEKPFDWDGNILSGSKEGIIRHFDKNYNYKPLLFLGTSRLLSLCHIEGNKFAASNMDGKIVVFKLKDEVK